MPTFYDLPDQDMLAKLKEISTSYHAELLEANANIGIIVCRREGKDGESMEAFAPALARVRVTSRKARLHTEHDAIIEICHFRWNNASSATQRALLDHELTHLELRMYKDELSLDDLGRPKLRLRKDEIELTAFTEVIARHGADAVEWRGISDAYAKAQAALESRPTGASFISAATTTYGIGMTTAQTSTFRFPVAGTMGQ